MHHNLLGQAFVYLAAAVLVVPFAKRLGLGSVLGYLLAGVALGPFAFGLVGEEGQDVMHFAEFGVVMMLFLVGLELRPSLLWQLRRPILGLGGLQVAATAAAVMGLALAFGQTWQTGLALGLILAGSSTAIVLQSLTEKGLLKNPAGQAAFSVLLFQDIAVIPILAVLPLLAAEAPAAAPHVGRPGWQQALLVLGAVGGIGAGGRFLMGPLFRFLAKTELREIFTAAALTLVLGITLLMGTVGLSPALGTFLAGVVLADSEYRHELEADIEPFKGLLLGVFFIAVGASIDFATIGSQPGLIAALVVGIMLLKAALLLVLGRLFGLNRAGYVQLAVSLCQVGEFAFVLFSFALQQNVLEPRLVNPLVAAVALSMLVTPLLLMLFERQMLPVLTRDQASGRPDDEFDGREGAVVIAGFGRFGQIVGRLLRASGVPTTVLDLDPQMVDLLRRLGLEVHYGDASRLDLLHAARCGEARLFVLAVDDPEKSLEIATTVRKHFPKLPILARARGRQHYYQLAPLEPVYLIRETFESALALGERALSLLGFRAHQAHRLSRGFQRHDEAALQKLAAMSMGAVDQATLQKERFAASRIALDETERLLRQESGTGFSFGGDEAWDSDALRADPSSRG